MAFLTDAGSMEKVLKAGVYAPTLDIISLAADALRRGKLVVLPTETVYGLAADAANDDAIAKIYSLKNRPRFNPLIIHVDTLTRAKALVQWNDVADRLADALWPGPLTLILPRAPNSAVSSLASAGLETLALRLPAHTLARQLIAAANRPLAAPSANPSESLSPTTAAHVWNAFKDSKACPPIIDGGACTTGVESTIIDLTGKPTLLRYGSISPSAIEDIIGPLFKTNPPTLRPKAPGQTLRHYAPCHPLRLNALSVTPAEVLLAFGPHPLQGASYTLNLSPRGNLSEAAANLFAMLHQLDQCACEDIAVMPIPEEELGLAINDRLRRGAALSAHALSA